MSAGAVVNIVDDDADLGDSIARLLRRNGFVAESFLDPAALLATHKSHRAHCVLTDVMMGDLDGFSFADRLRSIDPAAAIVFMTAWPAIANAVDAVRRYGGLDYLEKPIDESRLLAAVSEGVTWSRTRRNIMSRTSTLTPRERQVFGLLVQGHSNKVIADRLGLSSKTVEDHRAAVLSKTGANGIAGLIELVW